MLQLPFIRDNRDLTIAGLRKKHFENAEEIIDSLLDIDQQRRTIQSKLDTSRAELRTNTRGEYIRIEMLRSTSARSSDEVEKDAINKHIEAQLSKLKEYSDRSKASIKVLEENLKELEYREHTVLTSIPNLPHESVPAGRTAEDNEQVFSWGNYPSLPVDALPHWELIKKAAIIDFELGNKITGAGFPVYRGKGARIQRALINFFLDEALAAGYLEIQPPILINEASGFGTGQLPDKEGQMYEATADKLYLIPTAEVPITNIYRDVILTESELPVKNVGYTPCFRREAGSWGAHVRGLNRLHQFDKVEIVQIRKPEDSYAALDEMLEHVKGLLQKLELPFRILRLCGGDMSFTSALTYDFEVWSGAQQRWLECSSVSNFETYQANRLKLRYKTEGKTQLLHTLNGSALALPRILAAMLENNQTSEGIRIPKVLVPYCGFEFV